MSDLKRCDCLACVENRARLDAGWTSGKPMQCDREFVRPGANAHGLGPDTDGGANPDYRPDPIAGDPSMQPMSREEAEREIESATDARMSESDIDAVMEYVRSGGERGGLR